MPQTVNIESTGATMGLYDAEPKGAARGAIVVLQEAFGVNDHIEDICRRFAAEGYRAVAPHLFHRTGDPVLDYEDMQAVVGQIMKLRADNMNADVDATLNYLGGKGFKVGQVGIIGFCMGGSVSFSSAVRHPFGAAVSFYGGGIGEGRFGIPPLVELAPKLQCPWIGFFGDQDQTIRVDQVEALRIAVAKAPVPTEIVRYADADHGFHCDARDSYHEPSAKDAWKRTLGWFETHLPKP
jgi:carboxymethylenebutenolidase